MNILITYIGGPSPRSVARSLKYHSKFNDINLFRTDANKYAYGLYDKRLYKKTFLVPRVDGNCYWEVFYLAIKIIIFKVKKVLKKEGITHTGDIAIPLFLVSIKEK